LYQNLVDKFLISSSVLRKDTGIVRKQLSKEWIEFNQEIANSLSYIYNLSTVFLDKLKDEYNINYNESRYYSFHFDFIVSKPSNTIFTETPKKSIKDPFSLTANAIAGEIDKLYKINENQNEFNRQFQVFFHRTFLYYDFIFYKNEGTFTKSIFNKELFLLQEKALTTLLKKNIDNRKVFVKAIIVNIKNSLTLKKSYNQPNFRNSFFKKKNKIFSEEISDYKYNDIFSEYVRHQKANQNTPYDLVEVEVFSYVLANKVWKFDKIYQNRLEEFNFNEQVDSEFINSMHTYITSYLKNINDYYSKVVSKSELFDKIAIMDKIFISNLYNNYLPDIATSPPKTINISCIQDSKLENKPNESASDIMKKHAIKENEYQKIKFYRVLESETSYNIATLLNEFFTFINEKVKLEEDEIYLMGLLRSGSFLAHSLNVMRIKNNNKLTSISYSLLTHPFISIMPRELYANRKKPKTIYIDESIKSGYSVNIAHNFRKNFLSKNDIDINKPEYIFTLVDFLDYTNKVVDCNDDITRNSLLNIKIKHNDTKKIEFELTNNNNLKEIQTFDWVTFLNDLKIDTIDQIRDYGTIKINSEDEKLDLTKIISNSFLLFYIGKQFADNLNDYINSEDKNLILYSGSLEGKLLIDITIFIFKTLYDKSSEKTYNFTGKNINTEQYKDMTHYKKIFFDISIVSGSTVRKCAELDLHDSTNTFDKHLVVAEHINSTIENVKNIFSYGK